MEFMLLFVDQRGARASEPAGLPELERYAAELTRRGTIRRAAPLRPEPEGARIQVRNGRTFVSDGPFAESKEVVGGFWIVEAGSRDEAVSLARKAYELGEPRPEARTGFIDVQRVRFRIVASNAEKGRPFLFAFKNEPTLVDDGSAKMQRMIAYSEALERQGKLLETAPLDWAVPSTRVASRDGQTLVTDGPFAETKEVLGGYSFVRAGSREEALEIAKGYPAAEWGTVEVREMQSDPS